MPSDPRSRPAARSRTLAALLAACAVLAVFRPVAAAQGAQKAVLVLIPLQRGSSMSMDIDSTIRTVLNDGLAGHLDYYTEYLDVARFPEPDYEPAVRDFFRRKYASRNFDVVLADSAAQLNGQNIKGDAGLKSGSYQWEIGSRTTTEGAAWNILATFPIPPIRLP